MKQTVINVNKYNKLEAIEKELFDAYSKSTIMLFADSESESGDYPKEIIEIIEKIAFVFVELLPSDLKNMNKKFAPISLVDEIGLIKIAAATAANSTLTDAKNG